MAGRMVRALFILVGTVMLPLGLASAQHPPPPCLSGCLPMFKVSVSDYRGNTAIRPPSAVYTDTFEVQNVGQQTDTYSLLCSSTGGVTCGSISPSSPTVTGNCGCYVLVGVSYTLGSTSGSVTLKAIGEGNTSSATLTIVAGTVVTLVAPVPTSSQRAVVHNRQPILRALLFGSSPAALDTTQTVITWRGTNVTTLARANRGVLEWEVDSLHRLGIGDSAVVTVTACPFGDHCVTATEWVVLANDQAPVVGFTASPLEGLGRRFSAPLASGLEVVGADVLAHFAAPAYFTRGNPRSASLIYSTAQSYPRALVPIDVELPWPNGTPTKLHVSLLDGGTVLDSVVVLSPSCRTSGVAVCRVVLQGDFASGSYAAPTRKWLAAKIQVDSGTATRTATDSAEVVIVDRRSSPYGAGWWVDGQLKLAAAGPDRILIRADGTTSVYRGIGDSIYISPPGDFTTLTKTSSGWSLTTRGSSASMAFDANGRLTTLTDQDGNSTILSYSGTSDQLVSKADPTGRSFTLSYNSAGKLASISDQPGGSSTLRISKDSVNSAGLLVWALSASSTTLHDTVAYSYSTYAVGSGSGYLLSSLRVGPTIDSVITTVSYDSVFKRRPVSATLATVRDENGSPQSPSVSYSAAEKNPFHTLDSLNDLTVRVSGPRNNWARTQLNRWGQPLQTWDTIGTISRASYTPEGLVQWMEGKQRDSSRVYSTYDGFFHLVRSYIIRAAGDTFTVDTLAYDAYHRVSYEVKGRRDTTWFTHGSSGDLLMSVVAAHDTTGPHDSTVYGYTNRGLVDSIVLRGHGTLQTFAYDSMGNRVQARASGETLDSMVHDIFGRDSVDLSKLRVGDSLVGSTITPIWQWQKRVSLFNPANQLDSTELLHSVDCVDPCSSPPNFVSDSTNPRWSWIVRDHLGRDSLRLNARRKGALYLYDRLGRVVSRRPWLDSMAVRDSFAYDVGGNLKKLFTRRGDTITTYYDQRNRDTLTAIPGVGTLRKTFGGPLDEVSKMWLDSSVVVVPNDSLNQNAEVVWSYDKRGRLIADTTFTGTTPRATKFIYDHSERDSVRIDPLGGAWQTRYETARGMPDSLLTPRGDVVVYRYDGLGRAIGPQVFAAGALVHAGWTTRDSSGDLITSVDTVRGSPAYTPYAWSRGLSIPDFQPSVTPLNLESEGAGGGCRELQDTITDDGWGRLNRWAEDDLCGATLDTESYRFDLDGNIKTGSGSEVYDVTTDRLDSATISGCRYGFHYDRGGNLIERDPVGGCGGSSTYIYDALGHLRAFKYNGVLMARYAYDVLGRRIVKRVYSATTGGSVSYTRFVYGHSAVAFETDSSGTTVTRVYTWGLEPDELVGVYDSVGRKSYYAINDLMSSVRSLIRGDGAWILTQNFSPFGATIGHDSSATNVTGFALRYGWTGREFDPELGWYYFRARYYDPSTRRFVAEDPADVDADNAYAYVDGQPMAARDPTGTNMYWEPKVVNEMSEDYSMLALQSWAASFVRYDVISAEWGNSDGTINQETVTVSDNGTILNSSGPLDPKAFLRLAAVIYQETYGLQGNAANLLAGRMAIADLILTVQAQGLSRTVASPHVFSANEWKIIISDPDSPITQAWDQSLEAALSVSQDFSLDNSVAGSQGVTHFFLEYDEFQGKEQSVPDWAGGNAVYGFGPFVMGAKGGDVPKGATVYINFYR